MERAIIVIDPGHGGKGHPGCDLDGGLTEAAYALSLSSKVVQLLAGQPWPVEVYRTRTRDRHVSLPDRARLCDDYGAELFVSLHVNEHASPALHGCLGFFTAGDTLARDMIKTMVASTIDELAPIYRGGLVEIPAPIEDPDDAWLKRPDAVLRWHPPRTAVLWECGYASNPRDLELLRDPAVQWSIARSVVDGIGEYLVQVGLIDTSGHYIKREYEHVRSTEPRGRDRE
jgi:N-acetylmuramoyl-L-alanine amidase